MKGWHRCLSLFFFRQRRFSLFRIRNKVAPHFTQRQTVQVRRWQWCLCHGNSFSREFIFMSIFHRKCSSCLRCFFFGQAIKRALFFANQRTNCLLSIHPAASLHFVPTRVLVSEKISFVPLLRVFVLFFHVITKEKKRVYIYMGSKLVTLTSGPMCIYLGTACEDAAAETKKKLQQNEEGVFLDFSDCHLNPLLVDQCWYKVVSLWWCVSVWASLANLTLSAPYFSWGRYISLHCRHPTNVNVNHLVRGGDVPFKLTHL